MYISNKVKTITINRDIVNLNYTIINSLSKINILIKLIPFVMTPPPFTPTYPSPFLHVRLHLLLIPRPFPLILKLHN